MAVGFEVTLSQLDLDSQRIGGGATTVKRICLLLAFAGGHDTAIAWGAEAEAGLEGASEIGIAFATFGGPGFFAALRSVTHTYHSQRRMGKLSLGLEKSENQYALPTNGKSKVAALRNAGLTTSTAHRHEKAPPSRPGGACTSVGGCQTVPGTWISLPSSSEVVCPSKARPL